MKRLTVIFIFSLSVASLAQVGVPDSRLSLLQRSEKLTAFPMEESLRAFSDPINPFFPPKPEVVPETASPGGTVSTATTTVPVARKVTLAELAADIRPSGIMEIGGIRYLMFGESRLRAGDLLALQYQGNKYDLEIIQVEAGRYALRWNDQTLAKTLQN